LTGERSVAATILGAALLAAEKHSAQRRKDATASPYINHPVAVAEVLARHGVSDPVVLQAALLHDTLEDTDTTVDELQQIFGPSVTGVVLEVTDDKTLDKAERKRLQIVNAPGISDAAKLVKLGDKICNVVDMAASSPVGWPISRRVEYLDWTEQVMRGCRGVNAGLEEEYDRVLAEARSLVR
jgi:guanosine-3',5'-bis(diphosphate) 3'-pyrophosphohydrolase